MFNIIKSFLKHFLPPPVTTFIREINHLRTLIRDWGIKLLNTINDQTDKTRGLLKQQFQQIEQLTNRQIEQLDKTETSVLDRIEQLKQDVLNQNAENEKIMKERFVDIVITQTIQQELIKSQQKAIDSIQKQFADLVEMLEQQEQNFEIKQEETTEELLKDLADIVERQKQNTELSYKSIREVRQNYTSIKEVLWSQIFNNSISRSSWLKNSDFAPGRWAVGYPLLYVLFSTINKTKPQSILELGLGQSTYLISQYVADNPEVSHLVIEQSQDWIEFFSKDKSLATNTTICQLDYSECEFKDGDIVRIYKDFPSAAGKKQYDLILIDAPTHNGTSQFNRIDILSVLPECLAESFVIILDDCNRVAESNTAKEISMKLVEHRIPFTEGEYVGEKTFHIWCSETLSYLCTL